MIVTWFDQDARTYISVYDIVAVRLSSTRCERLYVFGMGKIFITREDLGLSGYNIVVAGPSCFFPRSPYRFTLPFPETLQTRTRNFLYNIIIYTWLHVLYAVYSTAGWIAKVVPLSDDETLDQNRGFFSSYVFPRLKLLFTRHYRFSSCTRAVTTLQHHGFIM